jgi:hypothetical protein
VETRILNVPENVNSSAVSPSPDAEILKKVKGKISRFNDFKKFEGDNFNGSPKSWSIQKVQEVCQVLKTIQLGQQSSLLWTKTLCLHQILNQTKL